MAVLIIFSIIGIITTIIGLTFLSIHVGSALAVELKTFKYKVKRSTELKKEAIDAETAFKADQMKQVREKEQDLANIKLQKKLDKLDKKILLEESKQIQTEEQQEEQQEEQVETIETKEENVVTDVENVESKEVKVEEVPVIKE